MTTSKIEIEGMMCNHCVKSVEDALLALDGVESAVANLESKNAEVTYDEDVISIERIIDEIISIGFDAE